MGLWAWRARSVWPLGCPGEKRFADALEDSGPKRHQISPNVVVDPGKSAFWKEGSKSWVLPYTYYWAGGLLGPELMQTMMTRPSILTTSDRGYTEFVTLTRQHPDQPFPLLPYKAHYLLEPPGESYTYRRRSKIRAFLARRRTSRGGHLGLAPH